MVVRVGEQKQDPAVAIFRCGEALVEVAPQALVIQRDKQASHGEAARELP